MANWSSGGWRQVAECGESGEKDSVGDCRDGHDAERQGLFELCEIHSHVGPQRGEIGVPDALGGGLCEGVDDGLGELRTGAGRLEVLACRLGVGRDGHGHLPPAEHVHVSRQAVIRL